MLKGLSRFFGLKNAQFPSGGGLTKRWVNNNFKGLPNISYHDTRSMKPGILRLIKLEWPTSRQLGCNEKCLDDHQNWFSLNFWLQIHFGDWHFLPPKIWAGLLLSYLYWWCPRCHLLTQVRSTVCHSLTSWGCWGLPSPHSCSCPPHRCPHCHNQPSKGWTGAGNSVSPSRPRNESVTR